MRQRLSSIAGSLRSRRQRRYLPQTEPVEPRTLLSIFTVVRSTDSGGSDGQKVTATTGDLRYCINQADLDTVVGQDTINFQIDIDSPTISLSSPLPTITRPVLIDGTTQRGIVLDGSGIDPSSDGLVVTFTNSSSGSCSAVQGLVILG